MPCAFYVDNPFTVSSYAKQNYDIERTTSQTTMSRLCQDHELGNPKSEVVPDPSHVSQSNKSTPAFSFARSSVFCLSMRPETLTSLRQLVAGMVLQYCLDFLSIEKDFEKFYLSYTF